MDGRGGQRGSLQAHRGREGVGWLGSGAQAGHSDSWNNRLRHYGPAAAWTGTRPTSSRRTWQALPGNRRTGREKLRLEEVAAARRSCL
jgi:hypothetical protein